MLPRQVAFRCSAGANVLPLDLLLCGRCLAAASGFNWPGRLPRFPLVLKRVTLVLLWRRVAFGAGFTVTAEKPRREFERERERKREFGEGWGAGGSAQT